MEVDSYAEFLSFLMREGFYTFLVQGILRMYSNDDIDPVECMEHFRIGAGGALIETGDLEVLVKSITRKLDKVKKLRKQIRQLKDSLRKVADLKEAVPTPDLSDVGGDSEEEEEGETEYMEEEAYDYGTDTGEEGEEEHEAEHDRVVGEESQPEEQNEPPPFAPLDPTEMEVRMVKPSNVLLNEFCLKKTLRRG